MKEVSGFITHDGTFFEDKEGAILYEAETDLREAFVKKFPTGDVEVFMAIIVQLQPELKVYANVYQPPRGDESDYAEEPVGEENPPSEPPEADERSSILTGTEEDLKSVLKLPTRRPRDVSNMGRRPHAKKVPD